MRINTCLKANLVFYFFLFGAAFCYGEGYLVYLKDKGQQRFDPSCFFHPNSLRKKNVLGLEAGNVQEWPVNEAYLNELKSHSDSIAGQSRWLNAVFLYTNDPAALAALPFVGDMELSVENGDEVLLMQIQDRRQEFSGEEIVQLQTALMEDSLFERQGIRGRGIRIAVFDAGFRNADHFSGLSHLFENGQVEQTFDFASRNEHVYDNHYHGTAVLTCLAGKFGGRNTGLATEARFLLARTEYSKREPLREEFFWLMAAEWADQHGADIISSSLGYSSNRYFYRDMNGKKSIVSRAAGYAVRRGISVINSAGNEGRNDWKFLITPADNDSVIAVGGLNPETGYVIDFSSLGPGSAGQLKPNVIASAEVLAGNGKGWDIVNGTSFSCPLVSGFVACMMSHETGLKDFPLRLMQRLEESAHLYPYFDYAHGYGVPKASRFLMPPENLQELPIQSGSSNLRISLKSGGETFKDRDLRIRAMVFLPKGKDRLPVGWPTLIYVSAFDEAGKLLRYEVCTLEEDYIGRETELLFIVPFKSHSLRFHYLGSTLNLSLPSP